MAHKGISLDKIALYTLSNFAYSFKFIYSPLIDLYYFPSIGRRKTYILPCNYFMATILFIMSFFYNEMVNEALVYQISTFAFLLSFTSSI